MTDSDKENSGDMTAEEKRKASIQHIGRQAKKICKLAEENDMKFLSYLLRIVTLETRVLLDEDENKDE